MNSAPLLAIRLSRRAVGVATLADEEFTFSDGRHLTSKKDRVDLAVDRYIRRLLEQVAPARVVLYAPRTAHGVVNRLRDVILSATQAAQVPVDEVDKRPLLNAFGTTPPRTAGALRDVIRAIWPESSAVAGQVSPLVMEAGAAALYADTALALEAPA